MKRKLLAAAASAFIASLALAAEPADLSLVLFDAQTPLADAELLIDGKLAARTSNAGAARLSLPAGEHRLQVMRDGVELLSLALTLHDDENAELIATVQAGTDPRIAWQSTHAGGIASDSSTATTVDPAAMGTLSGRIVDSESGVGIADARIFIAGTPVDIVTDTDGRFSASVAPGTYSLSVLAGQFSPQTLYDVEVTSAQTTERRIELVPAGLELPEFVVLEPYVEGSLASFVEEKRSSSAVADILGAEQISRAGDSDAAGALKRVTGLTLVDGKFVYVRGLGERYSSTLLNGAQVPSPDPTRRVVPLDLFPTEILSGIVVQKTWTADMPAEFAGGTIQLRTRGVPDAFLLKASLSTGWADGTTGDDGLRYAGGARDWTGFDSVRGAPDGLFDGLPRDPQSLEALGESLAAQGHAIDRQSIAPNGGFGFAVGDRHSFGDGDWSLGYIGALRYSQQWDSREEDRTFYGLAGGNLVPLENFTRERTERAIDASGFLSTGLVIGEQHAIDLNLIRLRQTTDEATIDTGISDSGNDDRISTLEWIENQLLTTQLIGEHSLPALGGLVAGWRVTDSAASRFAPNRRSYRFTLDEQLGDYVFESFNEQRYESLADDAREFGVDLRLPIEFGETRSLGLRAGASQLTRDRESTIRRFRYGGRRPAGPILDYEDLLSPGNIGPGGLVLQDRSLPTDAYTADVALDALYVGADLRFDDWRLDLGVRDESIRQQVTTVRPFDPNATPEIGLLEADSLLPSASLTWAYSDAAQLRFGFSETVSRPDIREQSRSNYIDPVLDVRVEGNPDLQQADIENLDLRWEYYFSTVESFSVALFTKDFSQPIELVSSPASGSLLQIANADSASNRGIEFDVYKRLDGLRRLDWLPGWMKPVLLDDLYIGANYARIQSEVDLGDNQGIQTNALRPLQGQSSYVGNVSLSYQPEETDVEATLLYNIAGPRISQVGISGKPDVYEQPFDQLDFTLQAALPWQGWKIKARLKNLLDPEQRFTQGGLTTIGYRKGREIGLTLEWSH